MNPNLTLRTRREFLRTSALGGALTWTIPSFLARTFDVMEADAAESALQPVTGRDGTILVVLQMAGGNDALNTVVPRDNDHYRRARPRLGLRESGLLTLNDELAMHGSLTGFKSLYDAGNLAVVQGVGYPNPNRSHFRSTEIWQTAGDADKFESFGWIGRYFDHACQGADPTVGVNVGAQTPQAFAAKQPKGVSLQNPEGYRFISHDSPRPDLPGASERFFRELNQPHSPAGAGKEMDTPSGGSIGAVHGKGAQGVSALEYLERTALDAQISSDKIRAITSRVDNQVSYPPSQLASSLRLVARLIGGGLPARIYYVSQGGYDTHVNQAPAQERLLKELGDAVKAFVDDLTAQGNFPRVVVMTFSEFGRRLAENANNGTDHGAAGQMFLVGSKLKAGVLGKYPSLAPGELSQGDPQFTVDFRSVYAGVLEHWLKTPSRPILGRSFEPLAFV